MAVEYGQVEPAVTVQVGCLGSPSDPTGTTVPDAPPHGVVHENAAGKAGFICTAEAVEDVACHDAETWDILARKGIPVSRNRDCAMLYNPQHLLGLEAPISILLAVRLGLSSDGIATRPTVDLVARTERRFRAGEVLAITDPHAHAVAGLDPLLLPAAPLATSAPVPYYLAIGCRLRHDVEAGAFLTLDAVEIDRNSALWHLRCEQDRWFFNETAKNA